MSWGYNQWPRSKTVAERRADAARAIAKGGKRGQAFAPIVVAGRTISHTFWGDAWCKNLERYQDYAYRLDRGRSYLRSGAVIDLQIAAGQVAARVVGSASQPYRVEITITAVAAPAWAAIQRACAGSIGSLVDLLAGTLSEAVMARLCAAGTGLFPAPDAIRFTCSCPDHATMCKHVAATMYGVGARLDARPELLFTLRKVTADELLASATRELPGARAPTTSTRILADDGLAALFGIDLAPGPVVAAPAAVKPAAVKPAAVKRAAVKRAAVKRTAVKPAAAVVTKPPAKPRVKAAPAKPLRVSAAKLALARKPPRARVRRP